ncbi:hypothetical protein OK016_29120 [Vibrio chagasii]|nr:hypothetical protein [Vibrio chagasii]
MRSSCESMPCCLFWDKYFIASMIVGFPVAEIYLLVPELPVSSIDCSSWAVWLICTCAIIVLYRRRDK